MPEYISTEYYLQPRLNKFSYPKTDANLLPHINFGTAQIPNAKVLQGNLSQLPQRLKEFIEEKIHLCQPDNVFICDGSDKEATHLSKILQTQKVLIPLPKYDNCWLTRTNPADVARVESKTFLCSNEKRQSIPEPKEGVIGKLGNWLSTTDMDKAVELRFPGCMKGRTMYVIPFSMGPVTSPLAKYGVQLTDSPYVVLSMKIMTRMGDSVLKRLKENPDLHFVQALHSVGVPANGKHDYPNWPCDPERTIILHRLESKEIVSYGSGYGGNSLLGKKCLALRIGSYIAKTEGWLAEHMLILGITNPEGRKRYIAAAFPSACGKTNLAMMTPTLPGYKIECVGDDIAWMKFNERGELRAINPENGFFGVAPGTSNSTNPIAMKTIFKDTIFTNVGMTSDGGVYWEGLENEVSPDVTITDWLGKEWKKGSNSTAAHPNSRFCTPARQCPILDPAWEDPEGVTIDAILFGGRRPTGVPLVYESLNWKHGVYIGASMRSETTAAAEYKGKVIMNDPFAMRPFFGYNFGHYLQHWLNMETKPDARLPKIFHVNWFRKDDQGRFLWPGFGENSRVLDWIFQRLDGQTNTAVETPIGYIPSRDALRTDNLKEKIDFDSLFAIDKHFWEQEVEEVAQYFDEQVGADLPVDIAREAELLKKRLREW